MQQGFALITAAKESDPFIELATTSYIGQELDRIQ